MRTQMVIEAILEQIRSHANVTAVWLAGSRGRGTNDEYSDIDIWIALDDAVMADVVADPLAWVHTIVPTMMHIVAPEIAPAGGAFVGSWVPVDDGFVQVDWYITPFNGAVRAADTQLVVGEVPVMPPVGLLCMPATAITGKVRDNLVLALQMVNNLIKHARRGFTWRAADHARHADGCLATAIWLLEHGTEPGYAASQTTFLQEPVRSDAPGIRETARILLAAIEGIAGRASLGDVVLAPVTAMHAVLAEWENTAFVPPEEYYSSLARRRLGAGVLVTDQKGHVLLLETTHKQTHEIPGGACEAGESPRQTARREVREEIGLELDIGRLLVFDHRNEPAPKGDTIMLVYDAGIVFDPSLITVDGGEIASFRFVGPDDLQEHTPARIATRLQAALKAREEHRTIEIDNEDVVL